MPLAFLKNKILSKKKKPIVAIFISGRGSNMAAILKKVISGHLSIRVGFVFSNNRDVLGLKKQKAWVWMYILFHQMILPILNITKKIFWKYAYNIK